MDSIPKVCPTCPCAKTPGRYRCSVSFNTSKRRQKRGDRRWICDSGANVICVDVNDPAIVRHLDQPAVKLQSSGGEIEARRVEVMTPFGVRNGLAAEGSPRLLPAALFTEFRRVKRVCLNGTCFDLCWEDDVPVLCGEAERGLTHVTLQASYAVTNNQKRKVMRKFRKRSKAVVCDDEDEYIYRVPATAPVASSPEVALREEEPESDASVSDDDVARELDFSALLTAKGCSAMKVKDPYTHTRCGCEWCRIAKAQKTPHLRNRGGWSPELFPGDLIIGDLCTGWFPSQDGETVALVLKDAASGLKYVKALKSKVPEGVRSGLSEFRLMLIDFRAWSGMPPPERPFVFHTDRGGEFGGKALLDWVAQQGGVMKLAPKGAHVSIAEQTVRDVLQGTRVGCYSAGLRASWWPFAARQHVHNANMNVEGFAEFKKSQGKPHTQEVFGRLIYFKPDDDLKPPKGFPTTLPGCFLGYDLEMSRGIWAAFYRPDGKVWKAKVPEKEPTLNLTTVDVGRTGHGIVWAEPGPDGVPRMAFKRIAQDLKELTLPNREDVLSGAPGMNTRELEKWMEENPPPMRYVDDASSCPACRGRNRAHTYSGTCLMAGLSEAQRKEYRVWCKGSKGKPAPSAAEQKKKLEGYRRANASAERRKADGHPEVACAAGCDVLSADQPTLSKWGKVRVLSAVKRSGMANGSELKSMEKLDMCGNHGFSTCGCGKDSVCLANYTVASAAEKSPRVSGEPEPEPSIVELRSAYLNCADAEKNERDCMLNSCSPADFARGLSRDEDSSNDLSAQVATGKAPRRAFVTRKMTREEKAGPGVQAAADEVGKMHKHGLYAHPIEEADAILDDPDATGCGMNMLSHVKHAERPGKEVYKCRAVVRGDDVKVMRTGQKAKMPDGIEVGKVAALEEVRAVKAYATISGHATEAVDLESAYFAAKFEVPGKPHIKLNHYLRLPYDIWRHLPKEYHPPQWMRKPVWRMQRAGYGHELSGHIFIMLLKQWLLKQGFRKLEGTASLYARGSILLAVYVDDLLAAGTRTDLDEFWSSLGEAFTFKAEPAEATEFLGIDFSRTDTETHYENRLSMSAYILDTCREYEKLWGTKIRPSRTPGTECIRTHDKSKSQSCKTERKLEARQSIVGRLLWICRTARPDMSHMASAFGARVLTWDLAVDRELGKTMGYLLLSHDATLVFRWPKDRESLDPDQVHNTIYTDADWMEPRSQSGVIAMLQTGSDEDAPSGSLPIHWGSKKQPLASDSSTSAEIIACHYGLREAHPVMLALTDFLFERGLLKQRPTVTLRVDNMTCLRHINKSYTDTFFAYSKACAVRISLLSDLRELGIIAASHVKSAINPADVFTKVFAQFDFLDKARQTGLEFPSDSAVLRANVARRSRLWRRQSPRCWYEDLTSISWFASG